MKEFEPLIGECEVPVEPRMKISVEERSSAIEGRRERGIGDASDEWEIDFPINYFRK